MRPDFARKVPETVCAEQRGQLFHKAGQGRRPVVFSQYQDLGSSYGLFERLGPFTGKTVRRKLEIVRMGCDKGTVQCGQCRGWDAGFGSLTGPNHE